MTAANSASLEGYVFLSDPDGKSVYLIERNGLIWQQHPELVFYLNRQERPRLWDWQEKLPGRAEWSFPEPGVPRLQLKNSLGTLEFIAAGEALWCRINHAEAVEVSSGMPLPEGAFELQLDSMRRWWRNFIRPFDRESIPSQYRTAVLNAVMFSRMAFEGVEPHYGSGFYGLSEHDGFPPTILSVSDLLLSAGVVEQAEKVFGNYLQKFVDPESGNLNYYGPSLAEYGMLLRCFARFPENFKTQYGALARAMVKHLLSVPRDEKYGLLTGSPEADERADCGIFAHNNAQAAAGLIAVGESFGAELVRRLLPALTEHKKVCGYLPWRLDQTVPLPEKFYDFRNTSYANYRYYPELLESGVLPLEMEEEILELRTRLHGEESGITTMRNGRTDGVPGNYHYDDWTLWSLGASHWRRQRTEQFWELLNGHLKLHTCPDTFICYEQVTAFGEPRVPYADFCVPSQLTVPRLLFMAIPLC